MRCASLVFLKCLIFVIRLRVICFVGGVYILVWSEYVSKSRIRLQMDLYILVAVFALIYLPLYVNARKRFVLLIISILCFLSYTCGTWLQIF